MKTFVSIYVNLVTKDKAIEDQPAHVMVQGLVLQLPMLLKMLSQIRRAFLSFYNESHIRSVSCQIGQV